MLSLLLAVVARSRRIEIGIYRAHGASTLDIAGLAVVEMWVIIGASVALGCLWAMGFHLAILHHHADMAELAFGVRAAIVEAGVVIATTPVVWLSLGRDSIASQLRD